MAIFKTIRVGNVK